MKLFMCQFLIVSLISISTGNSGISGIDYNAEFGKHWKDAEILLEKNKQVYQALAEGFHIPYQEIISIVFPELVRYSAIRNKIEVTLLKTLYVYKGNDYADFSVGIFQMKPSFAEKIREEANHLNDSIIQAIFGSEKFSPKNELHRSRLINELDDPIIQFKYLLAFYKLCEIRFKKGNADVIEKVKLYATAYNCGFYYTESYIKKFIGKEFYSINTFKTGPYYSYSDISVFYYNANH